MICVWSVCLVLQIIEFKFCWVFSRSLKWPTMLVTVLITLGLMFNIAPVLYRIVRFEICLTMYHIIISPFGVVKFKTFFLADILTSSKISLNDTFSALCFFTSGEYHSPEPTTCTYIIPSQYVSMVLPLRFRLLQSLKRFYCDRKNYSQLWNSLKFGVSLVAGVLFDLARHYGMYTYDS